MNDNLSYDIGQLENLAEVSKEASVVLEEIRRYAYAQMYSVMSAKGISIHRPPAYGGVMGQKEYRMLLPTHTWVVWKKEEKGRAVKVGHGTGLSYSDAVSYLLLYAYKHNAKNYCKDDKTYYSDDKKTMVRMVIKEIVYEKDSSREGSAGGRSGRLRSPKRSN